MPFEIAAFHLGEMGASAAEAIPSLLLIAQDESQQMHLRVTSAEAVTMIDPSQTTAVIDVLINALNDDFLQFTTAWHLGWLGKQAEPALPALFGLLTNDCASVKSTAAEAIWRITRDRTHAERVREALLRSEDWLVRQIGESVFEA